MSQTKRLRAFEKALRENKKMENDEHIRGYNIGRDGSNAYAMKIRGLEGVRLPKSSGLDANGSEVSCELHFTFMYKDQGDQFYFGRTCKTRKIKLKRGNDGSLGHNEVDFIFFHTGLDKHEFMRNVMMVCESALHVEQRGRYSNSGKTVMSGGWALVYFDALIGSGGRGGSDVLVDFQEGTVRAMMSNADSQLPKVGSKLRLECG